MTYDSQYLRINSALVKAKGMRQRIFSPSFDREESSLPVSSTYDFRVRFGFLLLAVETGQQHSVAFPSSSSKTRHNAVRLSVLLRLMDTSCGARMGLATVTTMAVTKVVLYQDTCLVDPGSGPIFGSVSGSDIPILGIAQAKDTFSLY